MHTSLQCKFCVINTGGTFGDNTSPPNFNPIGLARRQLGWYLWKAEANVKFSSTTLSGMALRLPKVDLEVVLLKWVFVGRHLGPEWLCSVLALFDNTLVAMPLAHT